MPALAGVESGLSQGIRVFGGRGARYIGLAKTRLQHIVTAAAMNLSRMWAFLAQHSDWLDECLSFFGSFSLCLI